MLKLSPECPNAESDVIKHWKYTDRVYASIVCPTYNQDIYIKNAIDSFLSQVTEYRFEIIVHDDVSIDSTSVILQQYKEKFPNLITVITPNENQFSININMPFKHCLAISQGKYIALCEGDDFWCSNDKLQIQITELEKNNGINIVISSAFGLSSDGRYDLFCDLGGDRFIIPFSDCILGANKDFYPTASFLMRKDTLVSIPNWFYTAPVGDYYLHVFSSYPNGCIYLPEQTVVYRRCAVGSLSSTMNAEKFIHLRELSFDCGVKLLNMYGSTDSLRKVILTKQAEYLINIAIVSFRCKKYLQAISTLLRCFKMSFPITTDSLFNRVKDFVKRG